MTLKRTFLVTAFCFAAAVQFSHGSPLNLYTVQTYPDIYSIQQTISYNNATQAFSSSAVPIQYVDSTMTSHNITDGVLNLAATIDNTGSASSGSLSITGNIPSLGLSGLLLSGNLSSFGFYPDASQSNPPANPVFEFLFNVTGGSLAPSYGPTVGMVLTSYDAFSGAFTSPYNATGGSDAFAVVPEPVSASLMALGFLSVVVHRIRNQNEPKA